MDHPYGFPDLVLECIFSFQSGEDLKRSRLVCTKWNEIIRHYFLIPKMQICFDSDRGVNSVCTENECDISKRISSENFYSVFEHPLEETSFNAFMLKGQSWNIKVFRAVLNAIENSVQELSFKYITLSGERDIYSQFKFDNFNPKNVTKLYIKSDYFPATEFKVDCSNLVSVQYLVLFNCSLIKSEKIQIFIKEIHLNNVRFDEQINLALNEVFCFTNADKIVIGKSNKNKQSNVFLNLDGCASLNTLELSRIPANKWENCIWKVQSCVIDSFQTLDDLPEPFPYCKSMNIKYLTIKETDVDLSRLPDSIQKLELIRAKINSPDKIHFKNLISLKLSEEKITSLRYFTNISTLIDLTLESSAKFNSTELKWNLIPKTVQRLTLTKVKIDIEGCDKIDLDCLTLNNYSFEDAEEFIKSVNTKQLVISNGYINGCDRGAVKLMEQWKPTVDKFLIGQFFWWDQELDAKLIETPSNSLLSSCVDKKADYYVFQNGKGLGISPDEFFRMTQSKISVS